MKNDSRSINVYLLPSGYTANAVPHILYQVINTLDIFVIYGKQYIDLRENIHAAAAYGQKFRQLSLTTEGMVKHLGHYYGKYDFSLYAIY